jgi:diguanylate cyclase (GGDEF)-like protein
MAVAGLAVGLSALAGLALWGTTSTAQTTASVRTFDKIGDVWGQVFLHVSLEYEALNDYRQASTDVGRQPLTSAVGSAEPDLEWLQAHGGPVEAKQAAAVQDTYDAYTLTLRRLIAAGAAGDAAQVVVDAELAGLSASSLRKQSVANSVRKRLEMYAFLDQVEHRNQRLRLAAEVISAVDLAFVIVCGLVLLTYQRRTERQAVASRHQALHDGLTGIPNRVLLADRMEQALRAAKRSGDTVALLLLDLNRFKEVNDTLGHHRGDLLLRQVASRLAAVVREHDTVARLGGDEFAVLLSGAKSVPDVMLVAERVLDGLQRPADLDGVTVDVSGSLGVALYPLHSANEMELLQHADIAMYAAKRGHLGVALYNPEVGQHDSGRLNLLGELHRAIDNRELVLHYQPKAFATGGETCGVEALVRWQHPVRGLLGPGEFIDLAADSALIHPLTDYVLRRGLEQHDDWRRQGMVVPIAVNIATQCLLEPSFVDRVAAVLAEHEAARGNLTFEITEGALIVDPDRVVIVLGRLQELGIRLSIDDFGTGYASMAYLQKIPLNELKIDRCFVTAMESSHGNKAIVGAVLQMAHALDLEVVAEGVEDERTSAALVDMGCDIVQGYYLSRPQPAPVITAWLVSRPVRHILEIS